MFARRHWREKIEQSWTERSVIFLRGVRRAGKTLLAQSLSDTMYFDCELPRVRAQMEEPEAFLRSLGEGRVVLDEIHRLRDPAELLKIASDHFPKLRVLATGSSSLSAVGKFRDTLTGRKRDIHLTPMIHADLVDFGNIPLDKRLLQGGLPSFLLSSKFPEKDFQEWVDSFWAKDIQELFRVERRYSFLKFFELLALQSGGLFEASSFAAPCEISRTTVSNYLAVLEQALVLQVIRPFHSKKSKEIVAAPKVYVFDTGVVCFYRGWDTLRPTDRGELWEHLVLNEIQGLGQGVELRYWRTIQGAEIDFILAGRGMPPIAIECKWSMSAFDPAALKKFRANYPKGDNYVVCSDVERNIERNVDGLTVNFVGIHGLPKILGKRG